jgi:hypothetical protein
LTVVPGARLTVPETPTVPATVVVPVALIGTGWLSAFTTRTLCGPVLPAACWRVPTPGGSSGSTVDDAAAGAHDATPSAASTPIPKPAIFLVLSMVASSSDPCPTDRLGSVEK